MNDFYDRMVFDKCQRYEDSDNHLGDLMSNLTLIGIIFKDVSAFIFNKYTYIMINCILYEQKVLFIKIK